MRRTITIKANDGSTNIEITAHLKLPRSSAMYEIKDTAEKFRNRIYDHVLRPSFNVSDITVVK